MVALALALLIFHGPERGPTPRGGQKAKLAEPCQRRQVGTPGVPPPRTNVQLGPSAVGSPSWVADQGAGRFPQARPPQVSRATRSLRAALLSTVVAAGTLALAAPPEAGADAHRARRADDFVNSVGVNVHLGYTNTPYRRHDLVQKKLRELGVRYIRDGLSLEQAA